MFGTQNHVERSLPVFFLSKIGALKKKFHVLNIFQTDLRYIWSWAVSKQCQMVGVRHTLVCLGNPIMSPKARHPLARNRFLRNSVSTVPHMGDLIIFHSLKYVSIFVEKKSQYQKIFFTDVTALQMHQILLISYKNWTFDVACTTWHSHYCGMRRIWCIWRAVTSVQNIFW